MGGAVVGTVVEGVAGAVPGAVVELAQPCGPPGAIAVAVGAAPAPVGDPSLVDAPPGAAEGTSDDGGVARRLAPPVAVDAGGTATGWARGEPVS
ncbi:MAG TPA: hypothetical protein VED63_00155, partial [Acidimicrobiales bacterium]|nr:hypothetical protein [Acidimicrobiales bacterium]